MMSEANNTARKVSDAMVAEHAKWAKYFQSGEFYKYRLKDTGGWSGTTRTSCPGTGSSHGFY